MAQIKLAQYTFDNTEKDCLPTLTPDTITMTKEDSVSENVTTRIIYIDDATMPTKISFKECSSLLTLDYLDTISVTNMNEMFANCTRMTFLDQSGFVTNKVANMSYMFFNCNALVSLDISNFNTSNVTNMSYMFYGSEQLSSLNLSNWDTSKLTNTKKMFLNCTSLASLDLSSFNTAKVTDDTDMFSGMSSSQKVYTGRYWTLTNSSHPVSFERLPKTIKLAQYKFRHSVGDCMPTLTPSSITMTYTDDVVDTTDLTTIRTVYIDDTTLPTYISFQNIDHLLEVYYLYIDTHITSMKEMFSSCGSLSYVNTTNWNTSNVTNMYGAFMATMIRSCNVSSFNTDKVTDMDYMFGNCSFLKFMDVTNFTTRSNMSTGSMFANNGTMKVIYDGNKWQSFMSMAITSEKVTPPSQIIAKYQYDTSIGSCTPTITRTGSATLVTKEVDTGIENVKYVILGYDTTTDQSITKISFGGKSSLLSVDYLKIDDNITSMANMFELCSSLTYINTANWDTTNVTSMEYLFASCSSLTSVDISNLDISRVTSMVSMFSHCSSLASVDFSNWDIRRVTSISFMFAYCTSLSQLDLVSFNTENSTSSTSIFTNWTSSQTVYIGKKWTIDTSSYNATFIRNVSYKYTLAKYTFDNSVANCVPTITGLTTSQWGYSDTVDGTTTTRTVGTDNDINRITAISFSNQTSLLTVDSLNITSNITTMEEMFRECTSLTSVNTSNWDVSNVTSMKHAFYSCIMSELDISSWDVGKVTDFSYVFCFCRQLPSLNISDWDVSSATNMSNMFNSCNKLTSLDLSKWNVSKVTNMSGMFNNCQKLTTLNVSNWNVSNVANMSNTFSDCYVLNALDLSKWTTSTKLTNMNGTFLNCRAVTSLDLSGFDVSNVTTLLNLFQNCNAVQSINVSNWNTSKVTTMTNVFSGCNKLTSLDVSKWNTSNVTAMSYLFYKCPLTTIDVSNWNTSKVTTMNCMFYGCNKLTSLDLSNFKTSKLTNMNEMFRDCSKLTTLDISNFTIPSANYANLFNGCNSMTNIGMLYNSSTTINQVVTRLAVLGDIPINIFYMDVDPSNLTVKHNITYLLYKVIVDCEEDIILRSNGDVCDELDLTTGQLTQRIGEDGSILEEEIITTVTLTNDMKFQNDSVIEINADCGNANLDLVLEYELPTTNCFVATNLKPNTQYTIFFEGEPTSVYLGGAEVTNPTNKSIITSGEADNVLWFDTSVSKVMLIEGDVTQRNSDYFTRVKSSQKIQVQLRVEGYPTFGEGGRR